MTKATPSENGVNIVSAYSSSFLGIEITSTPKGFIAGVIITILGAGLIAVYLIFGSKIKRSEIICQAFSVMLMGIGVILILVYLFECTNIVFLSL